MPPTDSPGLIAAPSSSENVSIGTSKSVAHSTAIHSEPTSTQSQMLSPSAGAGGLSAAGVPSG